MLVVQGIWSYYAKDMGHEAEISQNDTYFAQLDAMCMDPFISRAFAQIKEYNELLANQPMSLEDITEIVNEIDNNWYYLLGQDAAITGYLKFSDENDMSDNPQFIVSYYEKQDVTFQGVRASLIDSTKSDNSSLAIDEDLAFYELRVSLVREGLDRSGEVLIMTGSASVDDIITLEFNEMMSPERARLWLEHFHSDFIDEIDVLMLNPSLEECEMVMRLKDLKLTISIEDQDDMVGISKMALCVYVESLFSFDQDMPYAVIAAGEAWGYTEYGSVEAKEIDAASIAKVYRILWQPGPDDEDNVIRPLLEVAFLGADKDTDPLHLLVPIAIMDDFSSLRYSYFHGYPDDSSDDQE